MTKVLRFPCYLARIEKKFGGLKSAHLFYTLSLNLYPIPQIVSIYFGSSGFGSIFFRNFRINAIISVSYTHLTLPTTDVV